MWLSLWRNCNHCRKIKRHRRQSAIGSTGWIADTSFERRKLCCPTRVPLTDAGRKTARIVGSVPRCTPAKVRTCDLCVRKTADINIRDVADDTSIYQPSAHLEAAGTGLGWIGKELRGLRPFSCPPAGSVAPRRP